MSVELPRTAGPRRDRQPVAVSPQARGRTAPSVVSLDPSEVLTTRQVNERLKTPGQEVIIVAGAYKSGKTTLIIGIYEALQTKALDEKYEFADSDTIVGFERACFDSRVASGHPEPSTQRTANERMSFYHLALRR